MTISLGLLMLVIVVLAVKMKGAQIPHVILGMLLLKASTPDGPIDKLAGEGLAILTQIVNSVAGGLDGLV